MSSRIGLASLLPKRSFETSNDDSIHTIVHRRSPCTKHAAGTALSKTDDLEFNSSSRVLNLEQGQPNSGSLVREQKI